MRSPNLLCMSLGAIMLVFASEARALPFSILADGGGSYLTRLSSADVLRSRVVTIRWSDLDSALAEVDPDSTVNNSARFSMALFPEVVVGVEIDSLAALDEEILYLRGQALPPFSGEVSLTRGPDFLTGTVEIESGFYRLAFDGEEHYVEERAGPPGFSCGHPLPLAPPPTYADHSTGGTVAPGEIAVVDILVGHSAVAASSSLRADVVAGIEVANDAYRRSSIDVRLNLVGIQEVDVPDELETSPLAGPRPPSPASFHIRWQEGPGGRLGALHRARDELGADIVILVVEHLSVQGSAFEIMTGGGDPSFESKAFAVAKRGSLPGIVLGHEVGHLMGCRHAPGDDSRPVPGAFDFSSAYRDPQGRFKTIMASGGGLEPVARRFSEPPPAQYQTYDVGSTDQDNARSIRAVRGVVAGFRDGGSTPPGCPVAAGTADFCQLCGPCRQGEGDCDNTAECAAGLTCGDNLGPQFGFGPNVDVCVATDQGPSCDVRAGSGTFCSECGPCAAGQGDCDNDSECAPGLTCVDNIGAEFGFAPGVDVCVADAGSCPLSPGDPAFCVECGPCGPGAGDCDGNGQCQEGLVCGENNGADFGFAPGIDVCVQPGGEACPYPVGHGRFCAECGPCSTGEGDCDADSECADGLGCADNVGADFGFGAGVDVCLPPTAAAGSCPVAPGDPAYCLLCGPCSLGEGDCDGDSQCRFGLTCADDLGGSYGLPAGVDVCVDVPTTTVRLVPVADTYVAKEHPQDNFGTSSLLKVRYAGNDGSGKAHFSFLRFAIPETDDELVSASLRLRVGAEPIDEAGFYSVDLGSWAEGALNWTSEDWTDESLSTFLGPQHHMAAGTVVEIDVTAAIPPPTEPLTIGIAGAGTADLPGLEFWSRESEVPPELVLIYSPSSAALSAADCEIPALDTVTRVVPESATLWLSEADLLGPAASLPGAEVTGILKMPLGALTWTGGGRYEPPSSTAVDSFTYRIENGRCAAEGRVELLIDQVPSVDLIVGCDDARTCRLDASGSTDPEGLLEYHWSFGDGTATSTTFVPVVDHTYGREGLYTVSVTVTDRVGQAATAEGTARADDFLTFVLEVTSPVS